MSDSLVLALETSGPRGSLALARGSHFLGHRVLPQQRRHAAELLPAIADLLATAGLRPPELALLAFSQGPGSFTGLRVAATVARMWQSAVGCQVVAVPTLEALARNTLALSEVPPGTRIAALVDARQGRIFAAEFERTSGPTGPDLRTITSAGLHVFSVWLARAAPGAAILGDGVRGREAELAAAGLRILPEPTWTPDAREVLAIGQRLAAEGRRCAPHEIVPAYLRPPECEEVYEQRRAAARARADVR